MKPHHLSIVKGPFTTGRHQWMIPELLSEIEDKDFLKSISNYILDCHGLDIVDGYQFIVTDRSVFNIISHTNYLCYVVVADSDYFEDVPVFFENEWDENLKFDEMFLLGWTVNKYTEPAILYGKYPIKIQDNNTFIENENIINKWGLINEYSIAKKIAKENSSLDPYDEIWRPLAIFVDSYSMNKLKLL
ncbi:hypothetical protein [Acinetobacter larvae]|uniref:Uncharacterized protein n=1 Tax=Acinetobacter larvae TaxID=1789224 RepID=A0A1B2M311_9GAMM|nr:hypothetical protein [Acinetobacter larvae]AOA59585.1 hypothetical protein BFG52_15355 [Acinetobacter larvae]